MSAGIAVLAALLALPAGASAATRFAVPTGGSGSSVTCAQEDPCTLTHAVATALATDDVLVAPGDYGLASGVTVPVGASMHGAAGQPAPTIHTDTTGPTVTAGGAGLDHLIVTNTAIEGVAIRLQGVASLSNSVAQSIGATSTAVEATGTGPATLTNVTAWASGGSSAGIASDGFAPVIATNTIAHAATGGSDLLDENSIPVPFTMTNSNFATVGNGVTGAAPDSPGNQSAAPLLADPANGDFHQLSGSPTIDAGTVTGLVPSNGDIDGSSRTLGPLPDIGADEYVIHPPSASTGAPIGITTSGATLTGKINPNGLPTSYHFDYGATPAYGSSTGTQSAGSGGSPVDVSAALSGLQPGSILHYRLVTSNADGTASGLDQVLLVLADAPPVLPVVTGPSPPTFTALTLPGTVSVGQPITLQASGSDPDGAVNSIAINFDDDGPGFFAESACRYKPPNPIFTSTRPTTFSIPYTFSTPGTHTVEVTLGSNGCGRTTQTTTQTIQVNVTEAKTRVARARAREAGVIAAAGCRGAGLLPTKANQARVESATICLLNRVRRQNKLKPFRRNKKLRKAGALHNTWMLKAMVLAHQVPGEPALGARFRKVKYRGGGGENLGVGAGVPYATPRSMVMAWMNSPVHRANILERAFHTIGLAVMAQKPLAPPTPGATYTTEFGTTRR